MRQVTASFTSSYLSLDSWSETYIGARYLINNVLPVKQHLSMPEHGAISQMVLLASHHLIELILFDCIKENLIKNEESESAINTTLKKLNFNKAFKEYPLSIIGEEFPLEQEPFKSATVLQKRRNATIHHESALASLEMARSALFTGIKTSEEIYLHFHKDQKYKYDMVIKKYPIENYSWFSEMQFPEDIHKK